MKRLAIFLALLAAVLLQSANVGAASASRVTVSPTTVSGGGNVKGTAYLSSAAPSGGQVVELSSSSSYADVPATVTVASGKTSATFTITTNTTSIRRTATISMEAGGVTKTAALTIDPLSLSSVSISPGLITSDTTGVGTVKLNGNAPSGGFQVSLSSNSSKLDVPSTVTVPVGQKQATFTVTGDVASSDTSVTVTAVAQGVTKTGKVTVGPLAIKTLSASSTVTSGRPISPKITMNGKVGPDGAEVTLNSNRPSILPVPASVTLAPNATYLSVPLTAAFVSSPTEVTITARYDGVTKTDIITVNPVAVSSIAASPSSITGSLQTKITVKLNAAAGPGGYSVALSSSNTALVTLPATLLIAEGTTSAFFYTTPNVVSANTPVTMTASLMGSTKTGTLTVKPITISSTLASSSVIGGVESYFQVTLSASSPLGGFEFSASSSNSSVISVPSTLMIDEGALNQKFYFTPTVVVSDTPVTLTITDGITTKTITLTIKKPKLYSLSLNTTITTGGSPSTGSVLFVGAVPEGGVYVSLFGNSPAVVPTQIFVAGGESQASLSFNTVAVSVRTTAIITATWDGISVTKTLIIDPPVLRDLIPRPVTLSAGGTSPMTVRLNGPAPLGGYVVSLTSSVSSVATVPATVTVPEGSTSFTFNVTTSVSATNGQSTVITAAAAGRTTTAQAGVTSATLTSFTLSSSNAIGGSSLTGTLTFSAPAPTTGLTATSFTLDESVITTDTILVSPGASSVTFPIATNFVSVQETVVVYVSFATGGLTADLILTPLRPSTLVLDAVELEGGDTAIATLTLNGPTPDLGGLVVQAEISTNNSVVIVPAAVTFDASSATVTFTVTGIPTTVDELISITATFNGGIVTAYVTVLPPRLESLNVDLDEVTGGFDATGTVQLTSPAPVGGWLINLASLNINATVPATVIVPEGLTSESFTVETVPVAVNTAVTIQGSRGGVTADDSVTIIPPKLESLTVNDSDVEGGFADATGTVTLDGKAPAGGWSINLSSSSPGALSSSSTVTVLAGNTTAIFLLSSHVVAADTSVTATAAKDTRSFDVSVMVRAMKVTSLTLNSSTTTGGTSTITGTITINRVLPAGTTMTVAISTTNAAAVVPATVSVGSGITTKTFTFTTTAVSASTSGNVTATFNGSSSASLTVIPPVPTALSISPSDPVGGVDNSTGTVTLNGPAPAGGALVTLSKTGSGASVPANMTIAAGSTSGTFTITTAQVHSSSSVTVSGTYQSTTVSSSMSVKHVPLTDLSLSPNTVVGGVTNSTGTVTLGRNAPSAGVTVNLSSADTSRATVPATVFIPFGQSTATFTVTSVLTPTSGSVTITATYGGDTETSNVTVNALRITTLSLNKGFVLGGSENFVLTVGLSANAPAGGAVVALSVSPTSHASIPSSITIAAGTTTATVTVTTIRVGSHSDIVVTAIYNGDTDTTTGHVEAPAPTAVSVSPSPVQGGTSTTGTVTIEVAAPASGVVLSLTASNSAASVPATVTVAEGATTATFSIATNPVTSNRSVTITASADGVSRTFVMQVNAPGVSSLVLGDTTIVGGDSVLATVTLTSPAPTAGYTVTLTDNLSSTTVGNVTVAGGATVGSTTISSAPVAANQSGTVTATANSSSRTASLNVQAPVVTSWEINPDVVEGGDSTTGTVTISSPAPSGGLTLSTADGSSLVDMPSSITIPAGATSASVTIDTDPVGSTQTKTVSVTLNGTTTSHSLTLTP